MNVYTCIPSVNPCTTVFARSAHYSKRAALSGGRFLLLAFVPVFLLTVAPVVTGQTETVLHKFTGKADGALPAASLLRDDEGNLYGTTLFGGNLKFCDIQGCGTVFRLSKDGKLTTLYAFKGGADGESPYGPLVRDEQGNFYGTTFEGGTHNWGTVFKLTPSGRKTILYNFGSVSNDGASPYAGVIRDSGGNLYGTTFAGGGNNCPLGCGIVYEITASGDYKILWRFGQEANDGFNPFYVTLLRDDSGNLYGTTYYGGANPGPDGTGLGTVFEVTASGQETVLYSFANEGDGAFPCSGVVQDAKRNLFGANLGYVFEITASGEEKTIYALPPAPGSVSTSNLVFGPNGDLYGTTFLGGAYSYGGATYGVSPSGKQTLLYGFFSNGSGSGSYDGDEPTGGVVLDPEGNLYGTTTYGGDYNTAFLCENAGCGVVFKITP